MAMADTQNLEMVIFELLIKISNKCEAEERYALLEKLVGKMRKLQCLSISGKFVRNFTVILYHI